MIREIKIRAAYDKRDPNPRENYGVHGAHIYFTVKDERGGLTFSISTNWQLPHVEEELKAKGRSFGGPLPFGVDIHRKKPKDPDYPEGSGSYLPDCHVTGGECWCDGSGILGQEFFLTLIEGGDDALFERMERQFESWL